VIGPPLAEGTDVPLDLGSIDALRSAMTFHRERHAVLAGNIANIDTPGFRPFDLQRTTSDAPSQLATTAAGHIGGTEGHDYVTSFDDGGALRSADGNAVSLERELAKIDANRTRYAAASELVSRRLALLRYAAGDGT
jgi:flagellar basal-body rod protein FlgB